VTKNDREKSDDILRGGIQGARSTVRLVAQEAVKRKLVPRVGRKTVRILLLHHDLQPWRGKNVVCRQPG
jgi:hypothetical protein